MMSLGLEQYTLFQSRNPQLLTSPTCATGFVSLKDFLQTEGPYATFLCLLGKPKKPSLMWRSSGTLKLSATWCGAMVPLSCWPSQYIGFVLSPLL